MDFKSHLDEKQAANLLSALDDAIILFNADGVATFLNPSAIQLCNGGDSAKTGGILAELLPLLDPETRKPSALFLDPAFHRKVSGRAVYQLLVGDGGNEIPVNVKIINLSNENEPRKTVGAVVITDVSEARSHAHAKQQLGAIIESSDDIIASKDLRGIITSWNKGAERVLGYSASEAIGNHVSMLIPDDQREDIENILGRIRRGERVDHYETKRRRKDGTIIDVALTVSPIRDVDGRIIGASKVGRDITERRRLQEVREHLAAIVEFSDDMIISKDLSGNITSWNKGAEKILGYTADEILGKHISVLMPADHIEDSTKILSKIRKGETVEHYETKRRCKDGAIIDVSLTVSPIRNASGQIVGASKIGRNISEAKAAQRSLTEKERELRVLADTIPQLAWMANPDGYVFWFNQRWFEYTGKSLADMEGWGWQTVHDPALLPAAVERWKQSIATGDPFEMEFPLRGHDGTFRWFLTRVNPCKDAAGNIIRWFGTNTDISEQRAHKEALKASEKRLRAVVDATPECVKIVAPDGTLEFMNQAGIDMVQGPSESAARGASVVELIAPEHRDLWQKNHALVCAGQRVSWEFEIVGFQGRRRWMESHAVPLELADGRVAQLAVTRDITNRKAAEAVREELLNRERTARETAEAASKIKDEFLATLSHELRTPLGAILGWAQILESPERTEQDLTDGIEAIARNARTQNQLIEDLLDVSRIVTGKLRLEVQQIDPIVPLEAAIDSVAFAAQSKNIRLEKILSTGVGLISGDSHRIQQIAWNLLSNAIKFTPKGGKVQITARRVDSHVEIAISDSGSGISPKFLPFVFDRFRQADSSTSRSYGGLGLGLSIVKQLAELHGGTVSAASPGEGRGCTFTVTLPLALSYMHDQHPETAVAETYPHVSHRLDLTGLKVLVIDDELDSCRIARRILEPCGVTVYTANSADDGFAAFREYRPDVVVSDIGMPGKDGYELLRMIRSLRKEEGGQVPAAAFTAFARSEDRRKALLGGFQYHVVKPADPAELITVIASLTGRTDLR